MSNTANEFRKINSLLQEDFGKRGLVESKVINEDKKKDSSFEKVMDSFSTFDTNIRNFSRIVDGDVAKRVKSAIALIDKAYYELGVKQTWIDISESFKPKKKTLNEVISSSDAKALLSSYEKGNAKDEKELRKELKKSHTEIVKDFDKSVKSFMEEEVKRLQKQFPDYDIDLNRVSKRMIKDVSGNSDSQFGDWYDGESYRIAIHNKF